MKKDKRITLLTELHRPLEEHWAAAPRLGLDAQGSDYIYKFHVTRLQDIYSGQSIDPSIRERPPAELPNMSPVTQLYGANGLLTKRTPSRERMMRAREDRFNNHLDLNCPIPLENSSPSIRSQHSRSPSPLRKSRSDSSPLRYQSQFQWHVEEDYEKLRKTVRCNYEGSDYTPEDLELLGLYSLKPEEKKLYNEFASMLSRFNKFDRAQIIEDLLYDVEDRNSLEDYTGFSKKKHSEGHS